MMTKIPEIAKGPAQISNEEGMDIGILDYSLILVVSDMLVPHSGHAFDAFAGLVC